MFTAFDKKILLHYPRLWQSRILYVIPVWILIALVSVLYGLGSGQYSIEEYGSNKSINTFFFYFFASAVSLIVYLYFLTRYNYFKWFGKSRPLDGMVSYLYIFLSIFMLVSGYWIYDMAARSVSDLAMPPAIWSTEVFNPAFYIALSLSTLVFIYRHIPSRQFVIGGILLGVSLVIFAIFLGVSRTDDRSFLFSFVVLALLALLMSIIMMNYRPTAVHAALYIMYHIFVPAIIPAILLLNNSIRQPENRWMVDYGSVFSLAIVLLLIQFASYPALKKQWGRLE